MAVKNINYLVQNFKLTRLNNYTETTFDQQFLQFAIEGLRKLRELELLDACEKCVRLPIENNDELNHRIVNLPNDYTDYITIGVCVNGRIINLDKNNSLCLLNELLCPCSDQAAIENQINNLAFSGAEGWGGYPMWYYPLGQPYSYSYSIGDYGLGPGFYHGGYKLDLSKQQIILDRYVKGDSIVLTYLGDFVNDMGNAAIDENIIGILLNWMDWMRCESSIDNNLYRRAMSKKSQWYQSVRDYNSKRQKMNSSEWLSLLRSMNYLGIKM